MANTFIVIVLNPGMKLPLDPNQAVSVMAFPSDAATADEAVQAAADAIKPRTGTVMLPVSAPDQGTLVPYAIVASTSFKPNAGSAV